MVFIRDDHKACAPSKTKMLNPKSCGFGSMFLLFVHGFMFRFHVCLDGGFKYFLVSPLFGEDSHFD